MDFPSPVMRAPLPMPRPWASSWRAYAIRGFSPRSTKPSLHDAGLGCEAPIALDLGLDALRPTCTRCRITLRSKLTGGGGCVEVLLIRVEIDADSFEVLDGGCREMRPKPTRSYRVEPVLGRHTLPRCRARSTHGGGGPALSAKADHR